MVNLNDNRKKFEEMSGFKEIESESLYTQNNFADKVLSSLISFMRLFIEIFNSFILPLFMGASIVYVLFDLLFYSANMTYNFFRLVLLSVLLFYRYKRGNF